MYSLFSFAKSILDYVSFVIPFYNEVSIGSPPPPPLSLPDRCVPARPAFYTHTSTPMLDVIVALPTPPTLTLPLVLTLAPLSVDPSPFRPGLSSISDTLEAPASCAPAPLASAGRAAFHRLALGEVYSRRRAPCCRYSGVLAPLLKQHEAVLDAAAQAGEAAAKQAIADGAAKATAAAQAAVAAATQAAAAQAAQAAAAAKKD